MVFTIDNSYSWMNYDKFNSLKEYLIYLVNECNKKLNPNLIPDSNIKLIVVPHAGIRYSGLCSMSSYLPASKNKNIKKIIVLSTDHYNLNQSLLYAEDIIYYDKNGNGDKYRINIDNNNIKKLNNYDKYFKIKILKGEPNREHSFFNQIPFISYLFKNFQVTPIIVGNDYHSEISKIIYEIIDENTLIVSNSDLCHINGRFEHKVYENIYNQIRMYDNIIVKFLLKKNEYEMNKKFMEKNNLSLCGYSTINLTKKILNLYQKNKKRLFGRICSYYTSLQLQYNMILEKNISFNLKDMVERFDINNTNDTSVSYVGILFVDYPSYNKSLNIPINYLMTEYEKASLVEYSRHTLKNQVNGQKLEIKYLLPIYSHSYHSNKLACFVSINNKKYTHIDNKQRGCLGTIENKNQSLLKNVKEFSIQSGLNDGRYSPITYNELVREIKNKNITKYEFKMDFSLSILDKKILISQKDYYNTNSINLGKDSIIIQLPNNQSIYLTEHYKLHNLTDKKDILKMLCRKMGSNENCIKNEKLKIFYQNGLVYNI